MSSTPLPHRYQYPFIDMLRAAAALMVVVYHVIEIGQWREFPISGMALLFRIGWIGVDMFFVISGFVITLSAVSSYRRQGDDFRRGYMKRRWNRIAPLYFCTLLAYVWLVTPGILFGGLANTLTQVLSHVFFVHNLNPSTFGSINGPNWSVALEMQFYLLMAFIAPWLSRSSPVKVLLLFIGIAWSFRFLGTLLLVPGVAVIHHQHIFSTQLPGTLDAFGFGIALALLVLNCEQSRLAAFLLPSWRNFLLWSVLGLALMTVTMKLYWQHATYWDNAAMIVFWRSLLAAAFAVVLAATISFPVRSVALLWPGVYIGRISYGIYLWHILILETLVTLPWVRGPLLLLWTLAGTLMLAAASWHFLESPFMRSRAQPVVRT